LIGSSLGEQWGGEKEILIVNAGTIKKNGKRVLEILKQAHEGLYTNTFPIGDSGEDFPSWLDQLKDTDGSEQFTIVLAGSGLYGAGNPEINGICAGTYFPESNTAYLNSIVVDCTSRTCGLGCQLKRVMENEFTGSAIKHGSELRGWFLSCEDPAKIHGDGHLSYSPIKRLKKYLEWGGQLVKCDLVLPHWLDTRKRDRESLLIAFPNKQTGIMPDSEVIIDHLRSLYKSVGVTDMSDPDLLRMEMEINYSDLEADRKYITRQYAIL